MSSQQPRVFKFNDYETTRFLKLYSMERVLYDPTLDDYRDRDLRVAAAKRISQELNIPGFGPKEVIVKFKNLRSSYCQELKKISDSEKSESGTEDVYKPKVFWFELMNSFIRPFVQQRRTQSNLVLHTENSQQLSESEIDSQNASKYSEGTLSDPLRSASKIDTTGKTEKINLNQALPSSSKKIKTAHDHEINFMPSAIDRLQGISNRASQVTVNKDDSFDDYGRYVAKSEDDADVENIATINTSTTSARKPDEFDKLISLARKHLEQPQTEFEKIASVWAIELEKMNPQQQLFAKKAINEILFEGQMGTLRRDSVQINSSVRTSRCSI